MLFEVTLAFEKMWTLTVVQSNLIEKNRVFFQVRRLLGKVDEMKNQRGMLAEKFRQEVMEDDITKKLVVHEGKEMAEIFDIELQKHEATRKLVKQNMAAQKNILQAMTEVRSSAQSST